jgi:predicted patatin/cPLA2 family phospholipase
MTTFSLVNRDPENPQKETLIEKYFLYLIHHNKITQFILTHDQQNSYIFQIKESIDLKIECAESHSDTLFNFFDISA